MYSNTFEKELKKEPLMYHFLKVKKIGKVKLGFEASDPSGRRLSPVPIA